MTSGATWIRTDGSAVLVCWSTGHRTWRLLIGGQSPVQPQRLKWLLDDRGRNETTVDVVVQSALNGSIEPGSVGAAEEWVWDPRHSATRDTPTYWTTWRFSKDRWLSVNSQLPARRSPCRIAALGNADIELDVGGSPATEGSAPPGPGFHSRWQMSQRDYRECLARYAQSDAGRRPELPLKGIGELVKATEQYRLPQRQAPAPHAALRFRFGETVIVLMFQPPATSPSEGGRVQGFEGAFGGTDALIVVGDVAQLSCPPNFVDVFRPGGREASRGIMVAVRPKQHDAAGLGGVVSSVKLHE